MWAEEEAVLEIIQVKTSGHLSPANPPDTPWDGRAYSGYPADWEKKKAVELRHLWGNGGSDTTKNKNQTNMHNKITQAPWHHCTSLWNISASVLFTTEMLHSGLQVCRETFYKSPITTGEVPLGSQALPRASKLLFSISKSWVGHLERRNGI